VARLERWLLVLPLRFRSIFMRDRVEEELDAEFAFHIEQEAARQIERGLSPDQAKDAALRVTYGVAAMKDACRDTRRTQWLLDAVSDARYALRTFWLNPGFTAVALATLAVGIGANAAVFTITSGALFSGFPHVDPANRIAYIVGDPKGRAGTTSYPDFEDWRAQAKSFKGMLAVVLSGGARTRLVDDTGAAETYDATQVSANAFQVLGQKPIVGRDFTADDEKPGAGPVVMLSHAVWERRYGKDSNVVGQTVRINSTPASWGAIDLIRSTPATIIGVMPPDFDFPQHRVDLWLPLVPTGGLPFPDLRDRDNRRFWFAFGRLADGVTHQAARAEMENIGRRLERAYPSTNRGVIPAVKNFREFWMGPDAVALYGSMWAAVAFVLLIACANLANLLLGRELDRSREISIRIGLGAGRWRIMRQLLIESVLLSIAGGVLGWLIAAWGVRIYNAVSSPPNSYRHWEYAMDYRVLAYLIAISVGTGLVFGLAPAFRLTRLDINSTLKDGGGGAAGGKGSRRLSALLVIGEVVLAIVLLAGAGVMIRSARTIATTDLGVTTANVLTAPIGIPIGKYPTVEAQTALVGRLVARLETLPGVESLALATHLPAGAVFFPLKRPYELGDTSTRDVPSYSTAAKMSISADYFRTLGARLRRGRTFTDTDSASSVPVAIVNERFAQAVWPDEDPVGKRLRFTSGMTPEPWLTVVGVASDIVQVDTTGQRFDPVVYRPTSQEPAVTGWVLARTRVPPGTLANAFRHEIEVVDADLLVGPGGPGMISSLDQRLRNNYWRNTVNGGLFLVFATIALLLALVGLYAVVSRAVSQRTQEIGIRAAMGASSRDILRLVFKDGMLPVGIGLAVGLPATLAVMPVLKSQLVNVSPTDPVTLALSTAALVVAAGVGCWFPARRAMRLDPMTALRND
jgi:putative ABC transport system permease protein